MKRLATTVALVGLVFASSIEAPAQQQRIAVAVPPPIIVSRDAETPITLARAEVNVDTAGSQARTTLLLTLHNPNNRQLEGTLQFPLQAGQTIAAFGLDIDGQMRDAVPVPKEQGRQVFESIERRNVDPALLEQVAGNHFRLRVYPFLHRASGACALSSTKPCVGLTMHGPCSCRWNCCQARNSSA